jgi:Ca2+/Na+ antiporter
VSSDEGPPTPRLQFSIRFLLGLTAAVAATCAFGALTSWRMLLLVAVWYACIMAYVLIFLLWWRTLGGPPRARSESVRRLSATKLVLAWLAFLWFLFPFLVWLFARAP